MPERLELPDVDERGPEVPESGVYGRYASRRPVREAHGDVHHVLRAAEKGPLVSTSTVYTRKMIEYAGVSIISCSCTLNEQESVDTKN